MTKKERPSKSSSISIKDVQKVAKDENTMKTDHSEQTCTSFPIVGIGASAGGLAAFEAFFSGMPAGTDPGMAFVLVQHLAPDHKSILTELIRRYTRMQVFEVEDGMVVQPNCTYIIPPNRDMILVNGTLQLMDPSEPRWQRLPIDFFFRSLAHGPAGACHRHRTFGDRQRRHTRRAGYQGQGRHDHSPRPYIHRA